MSRGTCGSDGTLVARCGPRALVRASGSLPAQSEPAGAPRAGAQRSPDTGAQSSQSAGTGALGHIHREGCLQLPLSSKITWNWHRAQDLSPSHKLAQWRVPWEGHCGVESERKG